MSTILDKIAEIENEMAKTQKNKATSGHLGLLKAKLAKLKRELLMPKSGGAKPGEGFEVTKSGDARVGLIGFPSVGKSTLLSKLTGTHSEAAAYEFTTLTCVPGTLQYKGCQIQLLDLPGIIEGAKDGKGRGRQVIAVARTCNLVLIVLDAAKPMTHKKIIEGELHGFGIRLNRKPPNLTVKKKEKGGINLTALGCELGELSLSLVTSICKEYRMSNADVTVREDGCTVDDLIDVIEGNRVYVPCVYVLNKIDSISVEELQLLCRVPHYVMISAGLGWNLDGLLHKVWTYLDMVRVYTKPRGQIPDYDAPVVLPRDKRTVRVFCSRIHRTMVDNFRYAWVWGSSVKHNPQKVGLDHELFDEDIVQLITRV